MYKGHTCVHTMATATTAAKNTSTCVLHMYDTMALQLTYYHKSGQSVHALRTYTCVQISCKNSLSSLLYIYIWTPDSTQDANMQLPHY